MRDHKNSVQDIARSLYQKAVFCSLLVEPAIVQWAVSSACPQPVFQQPVRDGAQLLERGAGGRLLDGAQSPMHLEVRIGAA